MTVTTYRVDGAAYDVLAVANMTPLVPKNLATTTMDSLVSYELVQGYVNALKLQPYVDVYGVPSLKKAQEHVLQSTDIWDNTTAPAINRAYALITDYIVTLGRGTIFSILQKAVSQLDNEEKRNEGVRVLEYYLTQTEKMTKAMSPWILPINTFRESFAESARNFAQVVAEMSALMSGGDQATKKLQGQISKLNQDIDELNRTITSKKVETFDKKRSMSLGGIPIFSWLAIAAHAVITKPWGAEEELLSTKKIELANKIYLLANVDRRIAYVTVLCDEYFKLQVNCVHATAAMQSMYTAWNGLISNFKAIIEDLRALKEIDIENEQYLISIRLGDFNSTMAAIHKNLEAHSAARALKLSMDEAVSKLLFPRSTQTSYVLPTVLPNILFTAYANRFHQPL